MGAVCSFVRLGFFPGRDQLAGVVRVKMTESLSWYAICQFFNKDMTVTIGESRAKRQKLI
jgi:hypothetical protein